MAAGASSLRASGFEAGFYDAAPKALEAVFERWEIEEVPREEA